MSIVFGNGLNKISAKKTLNWHEKKGAEMAKNFTLWPVFKLLTACACPLENTLALLQSSAISEWTNLTIYSKVRLVGWDL